MKWAAEEYGEFIILFLICSAIIGFYFGMLELMPIGLAEAYESGDHLTFKKAILELIAGAGSR